MFAVDNTKATPALAQGVAFIASCMTLNPPEGIGFVGRRASMHSYGVINSITDFRAIGKNKSQNSPT
jgi:hypothetical protein